MDTDTNWTGNHVNESNRNNGPEDWLPPPATDIAKYDDIWKASNKTNLTSHDLDIPASIKENSVDAVRGMLYAWLRCKIWGSTVLKGAIDGFRFEECGFGSWIELGQFDNYWYPGRPPTRGGLIKDCYTLGGEQRIKCFLWNATKPEVVNSQVDFVVIPKWKWLPYFLFQFVRIRVENVIRKVKGQKPILTK